MKATVLVVEDDEDLRLVLADNLQDEGYRALTAGSLARAGALLAEHPVDALILDLMLPDGDGYSLCRALREGGSEVLVLMLTARTLEEDLVRGFEAGADDYLAKPYRLRELLLRLRALLRRGRGVEPRGGRRRLDGLTVEIDARRLLGPDGAEIALTRTEFDLLVFLLDHPDRALRRDEILDAVWGEEVVVDGRTVDNFVSSLKKKLGWTPSAGYRIRTVRGVGYRMELSGSR